jgi:hypothetical protein
MLALLQESIEWFIEDQAFLRLYDSAPRPPSSPPLPAESCISFPVVSVSAELTDGGGEGGGDKETEGGGGDKSN